MSAALFMLLAAAAAAADDGHRSWETTSGAPGALKYSSLARIRPENVGRLKPAWTYRSGDTKDVVGADALSSMQTTPVVVRDVMYVLGQNKKVLALEAATGKPIWVHRSTARGTPARRGLAYWESRDGRERRVFFTVGPRLFALDATTGEPIRGFGRDGAVTLYVDRDSMRTAGAPSPGIVFEDLIIMGSVVGEMYGGAPGNIRAYDVRTGELRWVFRTVPRPGEYGYETWAPDSWRHSGGANVWGFFSLDVERGLVFAPTGSPSYDFYGADRKGANLFGNCVIALDARTGKRVWHYQVVHHDLWDYDLSAPPILATITRDGRRRDAVLQVTKHGFVFVLDRETGEPLLPIEERSVPKSDVPGEEAWPTQPFPLKPSPVGRQALTVDDLTTFPDEAERKVLREQFLSARNEGLFTPPSQQGSIASPGHNGGPLWGGGAFDPETGWLYVSSHDQPSYFKLTRVPADNRSFAPPLERGRRLYRTHCVACHGPRGKGTSEEVPDLTAESRFDAARFADVVRLGKGRMPPAPSLSDSEVDLLGDYVRRLAEDTAGTAEPTEAAEETDGPLRFTTPWTFFRDSAQLPVVRPPWGRMTAIDMNTGDTLWQTLIGEEVTQRGVPPTGHKYLKGGPVVTAGGLVFMAGTQDRRLRAFDKRTGERLWTGELPFDAVGIPAVYETGGRQFVAVCAMASRGGDPGDAVVAFALPEETDE